MEKRATRRRRAGVVAVPMLLGILAAGCGGTSTPAAGSGAEQPVAYDAVPLTLPPNFMLRPPRDGGDAAVEHGEAAERILGRRWTASRAEGGSGAAPASRPTASATERLRRELGLHEALPDIRQLLAEEAGGLEIGDAYPVQALLCWPRAPAGTAADCADAPASGRQTAGAASDAGGGRPAIERRKPGFGGLF